MVETPIKQSNPIQPFTQILQPTISPPSEDFLEAKSQKQVSQTNKQKSRFINQANPKTKKNNFSNKQENLGLNAGESNFSNQPQHSVSSGFNTLGKSSLNNFSQEYVVPRDLQFINDKPFLKLSRAEINLNELFLRLGTQKNSFLKLSSDLVYQYHKYSVSNFSK